MRRLGCTVAFAIRAATAAGPPRCDGVGGTIEPDFGACGILTWKKSIGAGYTREDEEEGAEKPPSMTVEHVKQRSDKPSPATCDLSSEAAPSRVDSILSRSFNIPSIVEKGLLSGPSDRVYQGVTSIEWAAPAHAR